jgi:hypothetical protein
MSHPLTQKCLFLATRILIFSITDLYLDAFDVIQSTSSCRELELAFNAVSGKVSLVSFDVVID